MTRPTAPSLWLPGFDPDGPVLPGLPSVARPTSFFPIGQPSYSADEDVAPSDPGTSEASPAPIAHRASWRVVASVATASRVVWPSLSRADIDDLGGAVAKFEANLAAIDQLRQIEAENRPTSAEERQVLLRYTGWGGLPASFNLETEDLAWADTLAGQCLAHFTAAQVSFPSA